ncbi:MAG: CBS domain-containing protein, partial [Eggerthellaceae bacterium]|nr:CBS domain-containing protein [Eggerthellaceae bacterium]
FVDWPMLLWMFAALCLICLILGAVALGDVAKLTHPKLDAISIILIALALVGILYGISTAFSGSLPVAAVTFIIGCVCLALFVRRQNSLEEPLVKVSVLKVAPFRSGVLINMLALIAVFSMTIIIPTFMQSVLGATSLYASLIMFPGIVLACVISAIAGSLYDRHGIKVLLPTGFLLICAFSLLLGFFIDSNVEFLRIILFVPIACGALLIIGPVQSFSLSCLKPEDNAHGVTVMTTGFQISGCLGSSVFTGLYSAVANGTLDIGFSFEQAYSYGFLATGILTAACALIGLGFSIYIMRFKPNPYEDEQIVLANIMKPDVYTLKSNDTVLDALKFFTEKGISGAPVIDKSGEITGFLSDGDIVHYLRKQNSSFMNPYTFTVTLKDSDLAGKLDDLMKLPVGEIATKPVISVKPDDDFGKICAVIDENHLKKVPVVDDGKLVGVVNRSTVTRCAVEKYVSNNPESDKPALKETNGIQRS